MDVGYATTLAGAIPVLQQSTGAVAPWVLYAHQVAALAAAAAHPRLIVLKARQLGLSSVMAYFVLLQAIANPDYRAAIVADSWDNAAGLLEKVREYAAALGMPTTTSNARRITLSNKSTIDCLTVNTSAGTENKTGRSKTYHLLLLSEAAYYNNSAAVFASLTSALVKDGRIIIESTATPGPTIFRHIWDSEDPAWHKLFISCEQHPNYRADPASISDETWANLQSHWGFTDRSAAAWWERKYAVDFGGDRQRILREFPVLPEHSWAAASGRFIAADPRIANAVPSGDWDVFHAPTWGGQYIAGVDVAAGVGRDASAIVVYDLINRQIAATWASNTATADVVAAKIREVHTTWAPAAIIVEKNGLGSTLPGFFAGAHNIPLVWHTTTEATKYAALLRVKRAVEAGTLWAGADFAAQIAQVTYELKGEREKFRHVGDTVMALSFCLYYEANYAHLARQPPPRRPVPAGHYDMEADIARAQPKRRGAWKL